MPKMPKRCFVPGCKSNYDTADEYTPVFKFPREESLRSKWIGMINRADLSPRMESAVCIHHFQDSFIVKEARMTRDDGSVLSVPRSRFTLTADAYPTIFPDETEPPRKRKPSEATVGSNKWWASDAIPSFESFQAKLKDSLKPGWDFTNCTEGYVLLYKISDSDFPKIVVSMKVFADFAVSIYHDNVPVDAKTLDWILGKEFKCDRWSKFGDLINVLDTFKLNNESVQDKLACASNLLKNCCLSDDDDDDDDNDDGEKTMSNKLKFIAEQINLATSNQPSYSPDMLIWAEKLFFKDPDAYEFVRKSGVLSLPHTSYLKTLPSTPDVNSNVPDGKNEAANLPDDNIKL